MPKEARGTKELRPRRPLLVGVLGSVLLAGGELSGLQRRGSPVNEVGDNGQCTVARVYQVQAQVQVQVQRRMY
jgi:hypothetical protein